MSNDAPQHYEVTIELWSRQSKNSHLLVLAARDVHSSYKSDLPEVQSQLPLQSNCKAHLKGTKDTFSTPEQF